MRPSISVTLEPGLERGIPWGRDLYTFVTSAAGHMMRTLQKPRKNRPSKRQVNHRRFLHNMIQRKFADIEAANHRLASALYIQEDEKNDSSPPSQKPEAPEQSAISSQNVYLQDPDKRSDHTDAGGIAKSQSDVSVSSPETEISEKKQPESRHLSKRHPKSQCTTGNTRKNNQSKERQNKDSRHELSSSLSSLSSHRAELRRSDNDRQLKPTNDVSEDSQTSQQDSGFIQFDHHVDVSPSFSPDLSPLSLDSCDFSIQMFTDISTCSQAQRSIADISESQWTDFMDLFGVGSQDLGGCEDVEAYFESICACQGDAGQEVSADDVGFADQSDSFSNSCEMEDLHCETGGYAYQYSCHGDQGLIINHFHDQRSLMQIEDAAETQLNHFKPTQQKDVIQNQLHTSISCHYNTSELQTYQHPQVQRPCMLSSCEKNPNFTPFEGIAQSFSVPLQNAEHHPILTLPLEDDWLFSDILKDRKSPDC